MPDYEAVIGLEVHAQLKTRTKIFCGCPATFAAPPNSQTCPVCLGHPGALPVLNEKAVELAVRGALALACDVQLHSVFARKNYFYPDLPKGYQISQYEQPLALGGAVSIEVDGLERTIGLQRLHLEEDAGKSIHDGMPDSDRYSYIDLNRAGVPLIEIVTLPALHSPEETHAFLQRLRSILRYTDVCDGNMEQGSLRCDANVSLRRRGQQALGTRTELKNLNSFRNVQRALAYEIGRQSRMLDAGRAVQQQTVLWDVAAGVTSPMRSKEEAHDYRYFPDPDLPALALDPAWIDRLRRALPELPAARKRRFVTQHALSEYEAQLLTLDRVLAEYFEETAAGCGNSKAAASFILNDVLRAQRGAKLPDDEIPLPAPRLAELIQLVDRGTISNSMARQELLPEMVQSGRSALDLVREGQLEQVSDESVLRELIQQVIERHPVQLEQYRSGKKGLFGFFVGETMKASKGRANPRHLSELLQQILG